MAECSTKPAMLTPKLVVPCSTRLPCAARDGATVSAAHRSNSRPYLHVDFDERGGRHLAVQQTERVEQKVLLLLAHANLAARNKRRQWRLAGEAPGRAATHRDVVVDGLRPAEHVDEPVQGGELAAQNLLALGVAGQVAASDVVDGDEATGAAAHDAAVRAGEVRQVLLEGEEAGRAAVAQLLVHDALEVVAERAAAHHELDAPPALHVAHVGVDVRRAQLLLVVLVEHRVRLQVAVVLPVGDLLLHGCRRSFSCHFPANERDAARLLLRAAGYL